MVDMPSIFFFIVCLEAIFFFFFYVLCLFGFVGFAVSFSLLLFFAFHFIFHRDYVCLTDCLTTLLVLSPEKKNKTSTRTKKIWNFQISVELSRLNVARQTPKANQYMVKSQRIQKIGKPNDGNFQF